MKWKRIRKPICERLQPPGVEDVVKSNDSSQQMTTRHTGCRFARHLENIPQVSVKGGGGVGLKMLSNRHPVWRIVICCDESFDSSRIVSNRQHLLHCIVFSILTIDLRSFHALKTWKVHVILFSYHATHFHILPTRAPLGFRYVNAQFDIRCEDSSTTVDESQRFGCIGHVCQIPPLWNRKKEIIFIQTSIVLVTLINFSLPRISLSCFTDHLNTLLFTLSLRFNSL